jgi:hypothetical protein
VRFDGRFGSARPWLLGLAPRRQEGVVQGADALLE